MTSTVCVIPFMSSIATRQKRMGTEAKIAYSPFVRHIQRHNVGPLRPILLRSRYSFLLLIDGQRARTAAVGSSGLILK